MSVYDAKSPRIEANGAGVPLLGHISKREVGGGAVASGITRDDRVSGAHFAIDGLTRSLCLAFESLWAPSCRHAPSPIIT